MRLLITFFSTLVLALILMVENPDLMIKPGRLSDGHGQLDHDCFRCHGAFQGATATSCQRCHKPADIGRRTTRGAPLPPGGTRKVLFHTALADPDCMGCHTLHVSARHRKETRFRHDFLAADLRADCRSCHQPDRPNDAFHRQVAASCGKCHGTERWRPATFDHARYFRFDQSHPADCKTCHLDPGTFATYSCYGCHEHSPARIAAKHQEEGIRSFENCARCHRSGDEHEAEHGDGRREGERDHDED